MNAGKQYLRAADIAELTGASIRTVRRWIAEKVIPSRKLGGARLVARADLERLLSGDRGASQRGSDEERIMIGNSEISQLIGKA
jgi:excisionase family DNA binding protein